MTMARSKQDPGGVLKDAFDDDTKRLRVDIGSGTLQIDSTTDSIALGDVDGNKVTTTAIGADVALDVNLVGGIVSGTFTPTGLNNGIKTSKLVITDVPTKVTPSPLINRNGLSVRVWGNSVVYFGENNLISSTTAYPKRPFEEIILDIQEDSTVELWAVCASGESSEIRIIEIG